MTLAGTRPPTLDEWNKYELHHRARLLYRQPNPEMTSFVFWETLMTHLLLWGNAYAQIVRDGKNTVLLRGDYQSRMNGYATGISNGFLSPNDVHRLENMDLIPAEEGGDDYYLNGGYARIANLMSNETWMNAKKAVELGFADEILFAKKEEEPDSDPADPENPEEDPDSEPGEGEEKKPFQKDTAGHLFSSRQMDLIVLNRLGVKPEDVGQKHTEPKEPPADPKPSAEPTPPAEPPANSGPVLDLDGKTEDGSIPYNILMKQLECMK